MQTYSKLLIVLPCHSLEDFPTHHHGNDAANLLANWTALWHPALIASCGTMPDWQQADNPDLGLTDSMSETDEATSSGPILALIPLVAEPVLDSELLTNLKMANAVVISGQSSRSEITELALAANQHASSLAERVDSEIAKDFMALGYAFLQTQLMTRQLRYSSNLDEEYFSKAVVAAAHAATQSDQGETTKALTRCFDILLEEKNGYYPPEPELIDVVLTATTTLGSSFARQLDKSHPFNVLITGADTRRLFADRKENAAKLKDRIADDDVNIVGGPDEELPDNLVASETLVHQLQQGRITYQENFGVEPSVFMRRRFGLTPVTPGLLDQLNFAGAIHATLDDGQFPSGSGCNIRWTGEDDRWVLSIGNLPLAADDAGSFLALGVRLGESIDSAHIASPLFVHWPDATCESFKDLVRITNYSPLFGNFVVLNDYFDSIYDPGYSDQFLADEYRPPFLKQAVERNTPNPISKIISYWGRFYQLSACQALLIQACARTGLDGPTATRFKQQINQLQSTIESDLNLDEPDDKETKRRIDELTRDLTRQLNQRLTPGSSEATNSNQRSPTEIINTTSFTRRVEFTGPPGSPGTLKDNPPVVVCDCSESGSHWVLEIPPMGSVRVAHNSLGKKDLLKSDPKIGEGLILRNEFFELQVDENSGGIRGVQRYAERSNLFSQQISMRIPGGKNSPNQPLTKARYTQMVADDIQLSSESRLAASIQSTGRLLDGENTVAEFKQTLRVARGKRTIDFSIELNPVIEMSQSINHYLCSRLAWKSEASRVTANTQESGSEITSDWFHATNYFNIVQDKHRVTMLTGGIPYHRRSSRRMIDSLLVVGNEFRRRFEFSIGVNIPYAMAAAVGQLTQPIQCDAPIQTTYENQNTSNWLFHFDCKNILATWWEPIFDNQTGWTGVQIRLRETEGRSGTLTVRCPRAIATGEQVNFNGDFYRSLDVAEDDDTKLSVEFGRFDYFQISIHWKP